MKEMTIDQTLVLCDLDSLLLDAAGNLPQLQRDVLQLFASRGGRLTVFSQRSPRAVRSLLGGVRLSAPALVCGGTLAYNFSEGSGTALCSFEGMEESVLKMLPSLSGVGIALQMRDGSTRAVRMSEGLVFHLKQEWTPFVLSNAADVKGITDRREALRTIASTDKERAAYYKAHTGREWIDARNYDLCLNSGVLGFDKCVDMIQDFISVKLK